jgi:hypothetical protein
MGEWVLVMELRASSMLGKNSTTELLSQSKSHFEPVKEGKHT